MAITQMEYDEIMRSYDQTQFRMKREQTARVNKILEEIPELATVGQEISSLSVNTVRQLFHKSNDNQVDDYKKKLHALHEKKEELLKAHGYSLYDLEIHYQCELCKDTGFVNSEKCQCFKKKEIEYLYDQSNIRQVLEKENFGTFSFNCYDDTRIEPAVGKTARKHMPDVVRVCQVFIDEFDKADDRERKHKNLLFYGETGVGKSFLSNCVAKELIEKSKIVVYLSAIRLFDIFANDEFSRGDEQASRQVERIKDCDLLIIDDLGTELNNAFTNATLFDCLNERMIAGRATIISTNLIRFSELTQRYTERVTSRLLKEYTFLRIYGDDIRRKLKA